MTRSARIGKPDRNDKRMATTANHLRPTLTWQGCLQGARLTLPILPGLAVYALAFGTASSHRGLTFAESLSMSAIVYAGAAQMLSLEMWRESWTPAGLLTVMIVTATVNARFVLMGAALQPWMRGLSPVRSAIGLFFLVDASWLIGMRYHDGGGRDLGVPLGSGLVTWAVWIAATAPGYLAGSLVAEPRRFALDLVMPVFFAIMAALLWRGALVSGLPWLVAGIVGLATYLMVPGYGFIVAGALAGAATGAFSREP